MASATASKSSAKKTAKKSVKAVGRRKKAHLPTPPMAPVEVAPVPSSNGLKPLPPKEKVQARVVDRGKDFMPTPRVVQMTATLAEEILNRNTMNRALKTGRVERYTRDMVEGNWRMNGETIKLTDEGDLLDGQHRLFAVIEAENMMPGIKIPMMVVEGLPKDVMPTIDTGLSRTLGDVLTIEKKPYVQLVASMVRWLYWYEHFRGRNLSVSRPTHSELMRLLEENPDLNERAKEAHNLRKARRVHGSPAIMSFVYAMAHRSDANKASQWLGLLNEGCFNDSKHPVHLLRERMIDNRTSKAKLPPEQVMALTIKSWNNFKTGKRTSVLRWSSTEDFPDIQ